ncbi:ABC transporter permease [Shewanella japonica]|uniref:ABC transporter permease n=1 Tax=Shewanella japonica TaxID=93973 RepID=UPI002494E72B|nr:ABC transporter permease subunit [Shewanella japonica]
MSLHVEMVNILARKERQECIRNHWSVVLFVLFGGLSFTVTLAGSAVSGELAGGTLISTISSLTSLSVFIIPLVAILISYDAFVGEREAGTLSLLLTYPISQIDILLGKFVAHGGLLIIAITLTYGGSGLLFWLLSEQANTALVIRLYGQLIISSCLLALVFILLSYLVSVHAQQKGKVLGFLFMVWFAFVLVFDLLLLALLVADFGLQAQRFVSLMMLLNPADIYRAINMLGIDASFADKGALSQIQLTVPFLFGLLCLWLVLLLFALKHCVTSVAFKSS